ncbi:unnamed protein product [Parajaminaea phylloscopi]
MKFTSSVGVVAAMAAGATAVQAAEQVEPRLFSVEWGSSGGSGGFSWNLPGSSIFTNWLSWDQSCASKPNYGASGKPWSSGKPGWYIGDGSCGGGIPKWDQGDYRWCSHPKYGKNNYCKHGNQPCQPPKNPHHGGHGGHGHGGVTTKTTTLTTTKTDVSTTTATVTTTTTTTAAAPSDTPVCNNKYQVTFSDYKTVADSGIYKGQSVGAAIIANSYLTYGLAKKPEDCLAVCDQTAGCVFVNTFLDVEEDETEEPRHSGLYTCALYSACESTEKGTNFGGQNDPNHIEQSTGWCKSENCK